MNKKQINQSTPIPKTKRRRQPAKIKKTPSIKSPGEAVIPSKTFHETFPITLEYHEGKDFKRCFFVCKEHCDTYLKRYNLKKGSYKVFDTKPRNEKEE
jgi:hypothetical protein